MSFILGIDTSCDETSIAVLEIESGKVFSNVISSQIDDHAEFGGVVPELASRKHMENLNVVYKKALKEAGISEFQISKIAVTQTPGLMGCLLVGICFAKALAYRLKIPLIPIQHLEAHLFSPFIEKDPTFPFLGLVVSGGHTAYYAVNSYDDIKLLGQTVDDAAGEAFDKGAKVMGLGYPGGPLVDKFAQNGDAKRFAFTVPRVKMGEQYLSFSGIKTAVVHHFHSLENFTDTDRNDLCASLQTVIVKSLIQKAKYFLKRGNYKAIALSGGVAMNSLLRKEVNQLEKSKKITVFLSAPTFCTDNAAMVAELARFRNPIEDIFPLHARPSQKLRAKDIAHKK